MFAAALLVGAVAILSFGTALGINITCALTSQTIGPLPNFLVALGLSLCSITVILTGVHKESALLMAAGAITFVVSTAWTASILRAGIRAHH